MTLFNLTRLTPKHLPPNPPKQNPLPAQGQSATPEAANSRPAAPPPCKPAAASHPSDLPVNPSDYTHATPDGTNVDLDIYRAMTPEQQKAHDHDVEVLTKNAYDALPQDKRDAMKINACPASIRSALIIPV